MENKVCSHEGCKRKIKAVDSIMGFCRCEKIFCKRHRLPESHNCQYKFTINKEEFIQANLCVAAKVLVCE